MVRPKKLKHDMQLLLCIRPCFYIFLSSELFWAHFDHFLGRIWAPYSLKSSKGPNIDLDPQVFYLRGLLDKKSSLSIN